MAGCSQPGPATTVVVSSYTPPPQPPKPLQGQPPPWLNAYNCSIWKGTWTGTTGYEYCYSPHPSPADVGLSSLDQVYVVQDLNNIHTQLSILLSQGKTWDSPEVLQLINQATWIRQDAANRGLGTLVTQGDQTYIMMNNQLY